MCTGSEGLYVGDVSRGGFRLQPAFGGSMKSQHLATHLPKDQLGCCSPHRCSQCQPCNH